MKEGINLQYLTEKKKIRFEVNLNSAKQNKAKRRQPQLRYRTIELVQYLSEKFPELHPPPRENRPGQREVNVGWFGLPRVRR